MAVLSPEPTCWCCGKAANCQDQCLLMEMSGNYFSHPYFAIIKDMLLGDSSSTHRGTWSCPLSTRVADRKADRCPEQKEKACGWIGSNDGIGL